MNESDPEGDENITVRCFQAADRSNAKGTHKTKWNALSIARANPYLSAKKNLNRTRFDLGSFLSKPKRSEVWYIITPSGVHIIKGTALAYHHGSAVYKEFRFGLMMESSFNPVIVQVFSVDKKVNGCIPSFIVRVPIYVTALSTIKFNVNVKSCE